MRRTRPDSLKLACFAPALFAATFAASTGCVTDGAPSAQSSPSEAVSSDGDGSATDGTAEAGAAGEDGTTEASAAKATPVAPGERYELGPIESDDLKKAIYEGMEARLAHGDATSNGAEAATEIGDYEAFKFTIVKLTRGKDDVSGDPTTAPDGMDVEVTGWLRRTADAGTGEKAECVSFDAQVVMQHDPSGSGWTMAKDQDVSFGRQDQEDCY
jgi:hypothetical protein